MDDLDKRIAEGQKACSEAALKTDLARLKLDLFVMSLNLTTDQYEAYKNLEARIRELEEPK
jgi:cob(I)alamin adenosyltransferase